MMHYHRQDHCHLVEGRLLRKLHLLRKSLGTVSCLLSHAGATALVAAVAIVSAVVLVTQPFGSHCQTIVGASGLEVGDGCSRVVFAPWVQ